MDTADVLLAKSEIAELKARYCRGVDSKDWALYRSIFADEGTFDISTDVPDGGVFTSADDFVRVAQEGLTGVTSVHHVHNPEIEVVSATKASCIWAMEDMLEWGAETDTPGQKLHGMGHYIETYEKEGGKWVIKTLRLTRLRRDFEPHG